MPSQSLLRATLGLRRLSQTLLFPMPRSIDLSNYTPTSLGEEDRFLPLARHDSFDANTDGDSAALLEKGQQRAETDITKMPRGHWIRSPWLFLVDALLLVITFTVYASTPVSRKMSLLGDVTGYVPQFSQQIVVFGSHPEFISNHTSLESLREAREYWTKLLPRGQGYIKVTDDMYDRYDLPKPVEYKGTKSLGTSMMHSLHCLYEIMAEYDMLALHLQSPSTSPSSPSSSSPAHPFRDTTHMDHCIDYIRQMLLCGGDSALAGSDLPGGSSQLHVPHVCKNFDQMHGWLEAHRDGDAYQFGGAENHYLPP